ncbi:vWA domain-containing protein [Enhygromyxa salina]|uniref:vWA domain-containing protein n=1 Tax=Enhygromyxa salina TaxID=215803 RepID=UPI0015E796BE|nr:VWA domain-containing protein [Enhygromyxa salina]
MNSLFLSLPIFALLALPGCGDDGFSDDGAASGLGDGETSGQTGGEGNEGDGDGDGDSGSDSGDGDPGGDGDGDNGDGDGDADTGDGDGDGDGDESESESESETGDPLCNDVDDVILYLSPDDSNSMSSPVQVRERVLTDGSGSLSGVPVRVWEFMNYYGFDYPAAEDGELALFANMQPLEGEPSTWQLQLAVTSEVMTPAERPPMNLVLALDTSGSMNGEPMNLLKETCRAIAANLAFGDTVSIVEWDTENVWTLAGYPVTGPNDAVLSEKIEELAAGGGTDLNGGLVSGYELAQQTYDINMLNRIVLISDGGANAGVTDIDLIAENAAFGGSDGIYMVGVGVAKDSNYNDKLMNDVTDAGKGASVFVPNDAEAWSVFGDNFENTMAIAGRNVQVELTMPPGFEIVKFSGEEFSSDPKEVEPQHLAPNDAMVFHQQIETCAPELVDDEAEITVVATWEDPWTFESKQIMQSWTFGDLAGMDQGLLLKGAAVLAYAESLKAYQKAQNDAQKTAALSAAFAAISPAQAARPNDDDLLEIAMILAQLNP